MSKPRQLERVSSLENVSSVVDRQGVPLGEQERAFVCEHRPFNLNATLTGKLVDHLCTLTLGEGEAPFVSGDESNRCFVVIDGELELLAKDFCVVRFSAGDAFGYVGMLENRRRHKSVVACAGGATLVYLERRALYDAGIMPDDVRAALFAYMAEHLTELWKGEMIFKQMDVLLVQDGGCSPGYNPVTAFLSEYYEAAGYRVFASKTGYKSLVSGKTEDFCLLLHDEQVMGDLMRVPNVVHSPSLRSARGARFRTERFPEFKQKENQKRAAEVVVERGVKILVCIGGNGTFFGARSLCEFLPPEVQVFFIPATIDSDVFGTECLGEHTAVEYGASKLRCYMGDARTHDRCYIIEMMGRDGGFHCLHSSLGAGCHLAVMPFSKLNLRSLAKCINKRTYTVIAVAEGYGREQRKAANFDGSAASWLLSQLRETGKLDAGKKVVCEPFSRDIRGAVPNNLDLVLAQKMARRVVDLSIDGRSHLMPSVLNTTVTEISFNDIQTDNTVSDAEVQLANRILREDCDSDSE